MMDTEWLIINAIFALLILLINWFYRVFVHSVSFSSLSDSLINTSEDSHHNPTSSSTDHED